MPDLKDLLGKDSEEDQGLTENSAQINPLEATPDNGKAEEGNPLEKMDKISKRKDDKKKSKDGKKLEPETLEDMLMTGENTKGMFEPDEKDSEGTEPKLNEEVDEDAKRKLDKGEVKPSEKYEKNFKNDLLKHPNDYKVNTPEGEMTIAEAIQRGYNPITKQFENEHDMRAKKEALMGQLNDSDRANIERITNPSAAQIAPADANKFGLDANNPMVRQSMPEGGMIPQGGMPVEGVPQGAPAPVGTALPGAEESMAAGAQGNPIQALLGGNQ